MKIANYHRGSYYFGSYLNIVGFSLPLMLLSTLYFILPVSVRIVASFSRLNAIVAAIHQCTALFKTTPIETREADMVKESKTLRSWRALASPW